MDKWDNNYDENYDDFSYDEGKNRIMKYFKGTFKPTKRIIKQKASFFKQLNTIEEIFISGHSMSKVDLPYFKELDKHINTHVKWTVSYYNNEEYNRHEETLNSMGISSTTINFVKLDYLKINN
ncbi:bacteriophage abortive infection AbiH family protein [Myroides odoratus]|uniref:bacteriophage abortive infection AbiH family protein n=1 Tax=Myroides odoratus TaxID=256 RepID=UPI0021676AD1|nr:bacteriophage abortive infection AbiH family protein [Myroides odoratus]